MRFHIVSLALVLVLGACAADLVCAQTPRMRAEALFVEAQKALSRGDTEGGERLLKESLETDGSFTSAIWQLALVYESKGKLDYARELLLRGLRQEPDASWAREKLAQLEGALARLLLGEALASMNAEKYGQAIPKLASYLALKPGDPKGLVSMGKCHLAQGNLKTARGYLAKARASDPSYEEIPPLAAAIAERDSRSKLESLLSEAQAALIDTARGAETRVRAALQAVIKEDPGNSLAKQQLGELSQRAAQAEKEHSLREKRRTKTVIAGGQRALDRSRDAVAPAVGFIVKHLMLLLLAAVLCVLIIDVRRRLIRRSHPLEGTVSLIPVLDIVSLINANLRTGRLLVVSPDAKGEIYFEKGEIIHARCDGLNGPVAFRKLMDIRSGRFFFHNHLPNVRRTIKDPLSILLLSMKPHEEIERNLEEPASRRKALTISR